MTSEPIVTVTSRTGGKLYTRVFESILDSSINVQRVPPSARWLWITMLLIADHNRTGVVDMPVERLAAKAGLTLDQTLEGLAILGAPDPESRSDEEDGRRIVPIRDDQKRGWLLVNWAKYKAIAKEEQEREATRQRVAAYRSKRLRAADVTERNGSLVTCNTSEAEASSEASSEAKTGTVIDGSFETAWESYPRKRGKEEARRHFRAQVRTHADFAAILSAVSNYAEEIRILGRTDEHVMHGSTFFNNAWRDYVTGVWTRPTTKKRTTLPAFDPDEFKGDER